MENKKRVSRRRAIGDGADAIDVKAERGWLHRPIDDGIEVIVLLNCNAGRKGSAGQTQK